MGKPIDKNKPTKNFDELLEHLKKPVDDLDAFEQEALEGFATLESTQEAIDMKKRLDERMEEKLSEKRRPLFIYWSAAAGIALIFVLAFLLRTNGDLKSEEALADNTSTTQEQLNNNINNPTAPPAELKQAELEKKVSGSKSGKAYAEGESNGTAGGLNKGPVKPLEEQAAAKSNDADLAMADEVENIGSKDQSNGDKEANAQKRSDSKPVDDLAASTTKNQNNVPGNAAAGSGSDANNERSKAKEEEDYKEPKATDYFSSRKIKKEKKAAQTTPAQPKSEIEGTYEKSTIKAASLTIKDSELQQKIDKFFKDKDYKKAFVCTLTIDADNIVESVVFQNPDIFSKSQKKELTEFLLKLKCFKNHEFSVYSTYQLNYKAE